MPISPATSACCWWRAATCASPATASRSRRCDGLMPIDLIVRCMAGAVADPLELDSSGFAGPVGLLQAVRQQSRPGRQRAGLGAGREPRPERLPAAARQRAAGRGARHRRRPRWWLGDAGQPRSCARQPRPHGHPPGARGHGPARPRHPRHRPRAPGADRARGAAAGDRDQGRRAGRRGEGRLRHHAVADAGRAGAQALRACACS